MMEEYTLLVEENISVNVSVPHLCPRTSLRPTAIFKCKPSNKKNMENKLEAVQFVDVGYFLS